MKLNLNMVLLVALVFAGGCAEGLDETGSGQENGPGRMVPASGETGFVVPPVTAPHPRLMFTRQSLALMRERVSENRKPWSLAWQNVKREADAALAREIEPAYTGSDSGVFYQTAVPVMTEVRMLALAYLSGGDDRYARKAADIIDAWSSASPLPASELDPAIHYPNSGMEVARAMIPLIEACDMLLTWEGWAPERKQRAMAFLRSLVYPIKEGHDRWIEKDYFGKQWAQNHLIGHVAGLAAIGYVLGDRDLVQYAICSDENPRDYCELFDDLIIMPGDPLVLPQHQQGALAAGEIQDRYRHVQGKGIPYAHLSLTLLSYTAEICFNNGIDFYAYQGPGGETLRLSFEFYADFFQYADASLKGGFYSGEKINRGENWWAAPFEVAFAHYPDSEEISDYLKSIDRATVPFHPHGYFACPLLTHGMPGNAR